ncbi:MAG: SufS family cysteine desulfurase [Verrucomicrobia bacterium]|nr:SufS family cysteine desulfurase [Verrucomicrobiota bacterium]
MLFDAEKVRHDFPMLNQTMSGKRFVYLDSAATTHKPNCVIDAITRFYREEYATVHRAVYEHATVATEKYSAVRRALQDFINAKSEDEIVFTRGTTEALNLVARSYGAMHVHGGDEILISAMEHHANIVPWQLLAEKVGAKLIIAPMNEKGELILEEFEKRVTSRTKIVSICHVSNVTGAINPIEKIVPIAHRVGAVVVVDAAQSIAHFPIDVQKWNADFVAFSGHKMYGPTGVGVLYGKEALLHAMDPYQGGGDMVVEVSFMKTVFQPPPLKFEAGTPMIAEVIGLGEAISYIEQFDRSLVHKHEMKLFAKAREHLLTIPGVTIHGEPKERSAILSFTIDNIHPLDLGTLISLKGVALRTGSLCAQPAVNHFGREALMRISFGLYNTEKDVEEFITALDETLLLLETKV